MASPDLAAAISRLLNDDQDRILSVASTLRAPGRTIESTVKGTSMGSGLPPDSRIRIDLSPSGTHRARTPAHRSRNRGRSDARAPRPRGPDYAARVRSSRTRVAMRGGFVACLGDPQGRIVHAVERLRGHSGLAASHRCDRVEVAT